MPQAQAIEGADKDLPLRDDIRLLGRFRRDEDVAARRELAATLNSLPPNEALQLIRAFSFFSHLANIAEDQHHIRRTRAHALGPSAPREGTMAFALGRA